MLYALEMLEGMRHVDCSVYWRLWSFRNLLEMLEVLEVLDVPEVVCRLYAGGCGMREMLEVMRCVLPCMLEAGEFSKFSGCVLGAGGDALCATRYAGGIRGAGRAGGDAPCAALYAGGRGR